jgi:hypothetical protein
MASLPKVAALESEWRLLASWLSVNDDGGLAVEGPAIVESVEEQADLGMFVALRDHLAEHRLVNGSGVAVVAMICSRMSAILLFMIRRG